MARAVGDRVARLEGIVGDPGEGSTTNLVAVCAELGMQLAELRTSHDRLMEAHEELLRDHEYQRLQHQQNEMAMAERLEFRIHALEEEIIRLRQEARSPAHMGGVPAAKEPKVRDPKAFGGARSATEVENFVWDMENYFRAAKIPAHDQVDRVSTYLEGSAKLWWRTRTAEDDRAGRPRIETWEIFVRELRAQFHPSNAGWLARENLRKLRQTGSIREYVAQFSNLLLEVTNMSEEDKLFNFLAGLQGWAQVELRRREVRDIPSAFVAAEALVDFRSSTTTTSSSGGQGKGKRKSASPPRGRKGKKEGAPPRAAASAPKGPATFAGCFICGGAHFARDCPRKVAVAAVTTRDDASASSEEEPTARLAPLQAISTLAATDQSQGLMFVRARINGRTVRALVDSGATHNFVSQRAAHRLELGELSQPRRVKPVNSEEMETLGAAEATVEVGSWTGSCSVTVLPIDDYDVILGMEFLVQSRAVIMPHRRGILIRRGRRPHFVPVEGWRRMVAKGRCKKKPDHQT